ncbi:MAG: hypothetical protein ACLVHQ_04000 [Oscillospiraceae bacterium]
MVFNTPGANANAVKSWYWPVFFSARNIPRALSWASSLTENVSAVVEKASLSLPAERFQARPSSSRPWAIGRKVQAQPMPWE